MKSNEPQSNETTDEASSSAVSFQLRLPTGRTLGLRLDEHNRVVELVESVCPLVIQTLVQVGDQIVRVNNVDVRDQDHVQVAQLLRSNSDDDTHQTLEFERIIPDDDNKDSSNDTSDDTLCSQCQAKIPDGTKKRKRVSDNNNDDPSSPTTDNNERRERNLNESDAYFQRTFAQRFQALKEFQCVHGIGKDPPRSHKLLWPWIEKIRNGTLTLESAEQMTQLAALGVQWGSTAAVGAGSTTTTFS